MGSTAKSALPSSMAVMASLKVSTWKLLTCSPKYRSIAMWEYAPSAPWKTTLACSVSSLSTPIKGSLPRDPASTSLPYCIFLLMDIICSKSSCTPWALKALCVRERTVFSFSSSLSLSNTFFPVSIL